MLYRECSNGHQLKGPLDIMPNGTCRHCDKDRAAKYRKNCQRARKLVDSLQSRGIDLTDLDKAQNVVAAAAVLELLDVDPAKAQLLMQRDNRLYRMALEMVDKLAKMTAK